jgi:repressor LexA
MTDMEDKASFAIRRRMRELGLSQPALGKKLGKSHSWVNMYLLEKPAETIRKLWAKDPEEIKKLLHALQWTPADFARETGIELPGAQPTPLERMGAEPVSMAQVPLVGVVSAGRGDSEAGFMGFVEVPTDLVRRFQEHLYALRVDGDSMFCEGLPYSIPPGAYVVVSPGLEAQPGDLVVAWDEENGVGYLKEFKPKTDGYQVLRSWNPEVPPIVIRSGNRVRIQGVVVYVSYAPREAQLWSRARNYN